MKTNRRNALFGIVGLLAGHKAFAAGKLLPTPSQFAGPYYPTVRIPIELDLTVKDGIAAQGERLLLEGSVIDTAGKLLEGVLIEIWQADHKGRYRHPDAPETDQIDAGYTGFGATRSSPDGSYFFRTIMPVPYTGRPPHIHARLHRNGQEVLTTQLYLDGNEAEKSIFFNLVAKFYGDRKLLTIAPVPGDEGFMKARFNFVLKG